MRKLATLTLAAAGSNDKLDRGRLTLEKGKKMPGLWLKASIRVKNVSAGALAMTDAQRQALLELLILSMTYGKNGAFQPFQAQPWTRIQREARRCYGTELEGYSDSTDGLATSIAAGATDILVLWMLIPTGRLWFAGHARQDDLAMGRSQAATVELEVRRARQDVIAAGLFQLDGAITIDVIPHEVSAKGDRFCPIPAYIDVDESNKRAVLPDGLPLAIVERSAVHASSALTNLSLKIDGEVIHDQVSPGELITEFNDVPNLPAEASTADRETLLYAIPPGRRFDELPTGSPAIVQNVKDLPTIKLGYLFVPIYPQAQIEDEIDNAATSLRRKPIRAVSLADVDGHPTPHRMRFASGFQLFDQDDREFEQFAGYVAQPGRKGDFTAPPTVLRRAKAMFDEHKANGEEKSASYVAKQLAVSAPGAVQSGRGFRAALSTVLGRVDGWFR